MDKKKVFIGGIIIGVIVGIIIVYLNFFRMVTVTFTQKVGAGIQAQEVKVGEVAKEPPKPTYEGYEFMGWYLDGKRYDFNEPVKKDINLEAKWEKISDK